MGAAILSDLLTEILIPVAAVIGIAFALVQWVLVSSVKLSPERQSRSAVSSSSKNGGYADCLIEEEEGLNDHNVVVRCAEIQSAISEGQLTSAALLLFVFLDLTGVRRLIQLDF
ncbi:hypothetical protein ACLOJK_035841 [Asimina triloba]